MLILYDFSVVYLINFKFIIHVYVLTFYPSKKEKYAVYFSLNFCKYFVRRRVEGLDEETFYSAFLNFFLMKCYCLGSSLDDKHLTINRGMTKIRVNISNILRHAVVVYQYI